MRFGIRDILVLTFLVALGVVAFKGRHDVQKSMSQLVHTMAQIQESEAKIKMTERVLADSQPRMEYYEQVRLAAQSAIDDFPRIKARYSEVTPMPERVVYRVIPELQSPSGDTLRHVRLSVPSEYPVYLRVAMEERLDSRNRRELDQVPWRESHVYDVPGMYSCQLSPGMHDIEITIGKAKRVDQVETKSDDQSASSSGEKMQQYIHVTLDGEPLIHTRFLPQGGQSSGWSSPSGAMPYAYSLARGTMSLMSIEMEGEHDVEHEFWIWLSKADDPKGFNPFPSEPSQSPEDSE